jgi:hypothetical protein
MNLFKTYNKFKDENESIYLLGHFSDEITVPLIELSNVHNADFAKLTKRLSFLTAESFQNIVRHGYCENEIVEDVKFGMFSFTKTNDNLILSTANKVTNVSAKKLDKELKELNLLNSDELRSIYLETLSNKERTDNGGAGVGFISILRKTKGKLDYRINKIDENISDFYFQSNLVNNKSEAPSISKFKAEDHFNFMNDNNFLLFRKGIFDHTTMLVMTDLLKVKLDLNTKNEPNKIRCFIIVELIQNIYTHGYSGEKGHEGIFAVKNENNNLCLSTGNFVLTKNKQRIIDTFTKINAIDKAGIKQLLKERLLEFPVLTEKSISSGIGLLEIKKFIDTPIQFEFDKFDGSLSYLTITINNINQ